MGIASELRQSVLQAAMQGKLTTQKAEDGDARGLLLAIREEKEKLVKEKKIKKEKPLPPIADEEIPFDIPENWVWCRLAEICTKLVDGDHNPPKGTNKKTPYIMASSKNINNDKLVNLESVRYLSKEVFEKENQRTQAKAGDIFFTSVGSLGRSCVYNENINICFQRSVSVITTLAYNYFLKYCFDSPAIQNKVLKEATGTAQKGFYLNQLAAMAIPLPPLPVSRR
jgi:type I restriction enzyme S subunit